MLTVLILLLSVGLVLAVGESVRGQCRRMLSQPLAGSHVDDSIETVPATA